MDNNRTEIHQMSFDETKTYYRDKEGCSVPFTHVMDGVTDPALREIDELYGAADVLSIQNADRHRRVLLLLSAAGTLLTLLFLLYDEAELHGLILACGAMVLCLFLIRKMAERSDCHRKYLEYRVLAESLRCQFFLLLAGIRTSVKEIMPWSVRMGIPWMSEVIPDVPDEISAGKQPVLDVWIREQKKYHENALKKAEIKSRRNDCIAKTVLVITIAAYAVALLFELFLYKNISSGEAELIRSVLKIVLGTMSAVTLFTGSYYGKMSVPDAVNDHKRMISLYETAESEILKNGESEELLMFIAREFLNENSTWYAYQSKNKLDMTV